MKLLVTSSEANPMSTVRINDIISVDEYLEGELASQMKHEYIAGAVFAMVGAKNAHRKTNHFNYICALIEVRRNFSYNFLHIKKRKDKILGDHFCAHSK